jgi:signal transduction histidine kinase
VDGAARFEPNGRTGSLQSVIKIRLFTATLRLRQVVRKLLNNALKFTPENGSINIYCGAKNNFAEVVVADTGCGIEAEIFSRIFDRVFDIKFCSGFTS